SRVRAEHIPGGNLSRTGLVQFGADSRTGEFSLDLGGPTTQQVSAVRDLTNLSDPALDLVIGPVGDRGLDAGKGFPVGSRGDAGLNECALLLQFRGEFVETLGLLGELLG